MNSFFGFYICLISFEILYALVYQNSINLIFSSNDYVVLKKYGMADPSNK